MSSSWCTTLRPGNRGLPSSTSAKMQPTLQVSMAGLYFAKKLPHSSGALQAHTKHRHRHRHSQLKPWIQYVPLRLQETMHPKA